MSARPREAGVSTWTRKSTFHAADDPYRVSPVAESGRFGIAAEEIAIPKKLDSKEPPAKWVECHRRRPAPSIFFV